MQNVALHEGFSLIFLTYFPSGLTRSHKPMLRLINWWMWWCHWWRKMPSPWSLNHLR